MIADTEEMAAWVRNCEQRLFEVEVPATVDPCSRHNRGATHATDTVDQ
jgi:hypothetical protein